MPISQRSVSRQGATTCYPRCSMFPQSVSFVGPAPPLTRRGLTTVNLNIRDMFAHPSLQTKVCKNRLSRLRQKTTKKRATTRRAFMREVVLSILFVVVAIFMSSPWPVSRVSKIHHSCVRPAIARLFRVFNSTHQNRNRSTPVLLNSDNFFEEDNPAAVLWDSASKPQKFFA